MQNGQVLDFLHNTTWDDIPADVQSMAKTCVLDLLGVAAGSINIEGSKLIRNHAAGFFGAGSGTKPARILFDGRPASPSGAALAGALSIDSLDAHDGYRPTKGHVGVAILPTVLALIDAGVPVKTGQDFLTLIVIGYEIASRMGVAQHAIAPDYHASGSWNGVACAALASKMLGLSKDLTREAMGIAEYHGPRSQMMRCIDHPTMVKDSSGWGAMTGVSSAYMAQTGFTGAPALIVEDPGTNECWQDLGQRWLIMEQYFKPYPVCRWAQAAIIAAEGLQKEHGFGADDIEKIDIVTFHEGCRLDHPRPSTCEQAQYSLPFPVAAMLVKGKIGVEEITDGLNDPDILAMSDRIVMSESDDYNAVFPAERLAHAVITLKDGARHQSETCQANGDPETPLSMDEFVQKYLSLAEPVLGADHAQALRAAIENLSDGNPIDAFLELVLNQPGNVSLKMTSSAA